MTRIVPARCPRCERDFDRTALDHTADGLTDAGCTCGEITRVFVDEEMEERAAPGAPPAGWVERPRIGGWIATFRPPVTGPSPLVRAAQVVLALPVLAFGFTYFAMLGGGLLGRPGLVAGPVITMLLAWLAYRRRRESRSSTFAIGDGRFRARGHDVPLDDITRFTVVRYPSTPHLEERFSLQVVRRSALPHLVPLRAQASDAAFVAARLNEVLAAEGRVDVGGGYRGERLRIADDDAESMEEELSSSSSRTPPPRQRRA